jgi:hypothetical protein
MQIEICILDISFKTYSYLINFPSKYVALFKIYLAHSYALIIPDLSFCETQTERSVEV